eukprot:scaffold919_cov86-Isochrysis_galbana.AAC.2
MDCPAEVWRRGILGVRAGCSRGRGILCSQWGVGLMVWRKRSRDSTWHALVAAHCCSWPRGGLQAASRSEVSGQPNTAQTVHDR